MSGRGLDRITTRYDATILSIPLLFLGAFGLAHLGPLGITADLGVAAVVSGAPITDALFLNPPTAFEEGGE
ncbi:MAG: hypothetical protein ABEJ60_02370 [Halodesulfurarchaeum sp.]